MNIKSPRRLANTQVGASTRNKGFIVINVNLLISNKIGYFFLGCFVSHICNSCICFAFFCNKLRCRNCDVFFSLPCWNREKKTKQTNKPFSISLVSMLVSYLHSKKLCIVQANDLENRMPFLADLYVGYHRWNDIIYAAIALFFFKQKTSKSVEMSFTVEKVFFSIQS